DPALSGDGERPRRLHATVHRGVGHPVERHVGTARVHLPGEQPLLEPSRRRLRPAHLRATTAAGFQAGRVAAGDEVAMRRVIWIVAIVCALALPSGLQAQFGHPLKGQWSGEWGPKDKPNRLLLNFDWDGKEITGVIN